jgi:secreted trypsin-like serine protease
VEGLQSALIIAGAHNIHLHESTQQRQNAVAVASHGAYNPNTLNNDIAILWGSSLWQNNNYIRTIPQAPAGSPTFVGVIATSSGWGLTADGGQTSDVLKYSTNTVISNQECANVYGSQTINAAKICISTTENRGTCQGNF